MSFRPLSMRDVRWAAHGERGLEHLHLTATPSGVVARSVVIGARRGLAYGVRYEIRLDGGWRVEALRIDTMHGDALHLDSPEPGAWQDLDGSPRPDLDGCIDIDLEGTPFTNTLPIRRLGVAIDGAMLRMLYVPFDTFEPFADEQRYDTLEPFRRYRFREADGSFSAALALDEDGLVLDYPTLFQRL